VSQGEALTIQTVDHPQGVIVRIAGDCNATFIEKLDNELDRVAALHPPLVVLDLAGLEFIASLGLGSLLGFRQRIDRAGGRVRIAAAKPAVLDAFKRASLRAMFASADTVDEALN